MRHKRPASLPLIAILLMAAVAVVSFQAGVVSQKRSDIPAGGSLLRQNKTSSFDFGIIDEVYRVLESNFLYVDRIDHQKMVEGAVRGFVESLNDPYTTYFSPDEAREFKDFLKSDLEGIGAELVLDSDGVVTVVSPIKDSPAEKAGLMPRDKILQIDGEDTTRNLFEAVKRIKGPAGTKVCLTVYREEAGEPLEICIVRQRINIPTIAWKMVRDDIYHLELRMFDDEVARNMRKELEKIRQRNPKGLILDLRNNGGGYLDGATAVTSLFLPEGNVVTVVAARNATNSHNEYTRGKPVFEHLPMVVLVNAGSASASEITAAALQYYGRATVMGEKTFGKATAQEVVDFRNGDLLRLTIAKWLTPGKNSLENGLKPDVEAKDLPATEPDEALEMALQSLTSG